MKFARRPDLAPQTRIDIVMLAWLHRGVYGKMTAIAKSYRISRTFETVAEILDSIWTGQVIIFILPVLTFFSRGERYVWTG